MTFLFKGSDFQVPVVHFLGCVTPPQNGNTQKIHKKSSSFPHPHCQTETDEEETIAFVDVTWKGGNQKLLRRLVD